jgi:hypothetical protein
MLLNSQLSSDIMGGKMEILAGTGPFVGANLLSNTDVPNRPILAAGATDYSFPYAIPLMSILSLSNNYVPLFAMKYNLYQLSICCLYVMIIILLFRFLRVVHFAIRLNMLL